MNFDLRLTEIVWNIYEIECICVTNQEIYEGEIDLDNRNRNIKEITIDE